MMASQAVVISQPQTMGQPQSAVIEVLHAPQVYFVFGFWFLVFGFWFFSLLTFSPLFFFFLAPTSSDF